MPSSVFEVTQESLKSEPVKLVRFSHGRLKNGSSDKMVWKMYKKKRSTTLREKMSERKILRASVNGMTYSGQNFGPQAVCFTDTCDYYVAERIKDSNKLRILPAEIYRMEPKPEGSNSQEVDEMDSTSTFRDKRSALAREFGSGKSQRAILQQEKNKLDTDMVAETTRKVAESTHTLLQAANTPTQSEEGSAIPPHNKDAKTPGEVYKLEDIIKSDLMSHLATLCETFVNCTNEDIQKWRTEKKYSTFILDKLSVLAIREDARLFQSQCLMYLHCLIVTRNLKYIEIRKRDPLPQDWPQPLKSSILNSFTYDTTESGGRKRRVMPPARKAFLLSHILVLCLKLSGFYLNLHSLAIDLGMAQKTLSLHASALGCTVRSVKDSKDKSSPSTYIAELKVPLKFPEIRGKSNKMRIF